MILLIPEHLAKDLAPCLLYPVGFYAWLNSLRQGRKRNTLKLRSQEVQHEVLFRRVSIQRLQAIDTKLFKKSSSAERFSRGP